MRGLLQVPLHLCRVRVRCAMTFFRCNECCFLKIVYINNVASVPCVPCRYSAQSAARAALFGGHARCPAEEETEAAD